MEPTKKETLFELAQKIEPETVQKIKEATASIFTKEGIPFDPSHIGACKITLDLVMGHPTISPATKEYFCTLILILIRIADEMKNDSIISPIQIV